MILHHPADLVDIALRLIVLYLQVLQLVGALLEKAQESLFLFLIKAFELCHHIGQHLTDLSQILCPDVLQSISRKVRHLFLCAYTVL